MEKLIIILLLSPLFSKAQIDFKTDTSLLRISSTQVGRPFHFIGERGMKPFFLVVKDKDQKIICKVDTAGNLKVYGDTTTVLKTIIRNFNIKVN